MIGLIDSWYGVLIEVTQKNYWYNDYGDKAYKSFLALANTIFRIADCSIDFVNFTWKDQGTSKPSEIS